MGKNSQQAAKDKRTNSKRILLWAVVALLIVGAAVFFALGRSVSAGGNLLINGDFSRTDGEGFPEGWYADAYGGLGNALFETVQTSDGPAAHIVNAIPKDARFAQRVAVDANATYLLHGYIRANAIGGLGANLSIEGIAVYSNLVYDSQGEWQEVSLYGKTGPSQSAVTVYARLGGYSGEAGGEAYFRDVTLSKVSSVPLGAYAQNWFYDATPGGNAAYEEASAASGSASLWLVLIGAAYAALFALLCRFLRKPKTELDTQPDGFVRSMVTLSALLFVALGARIAVAASVQGYDVDIGCFTGWANHLAQTGPANFYQYIAEEARWNCDYPPGYLWILWLIGGLGRLFGAGATEMMVKLPPILADLALCMILYRECVHRLSQPAALAATALYALNPMIIITGAGWGQADALMTLLLVLVVLFAVRDQWRAALPLYMAAVLFKPQALMFGPLGLAALALSLRRAWKDEKQRQLMLAELGHGFAFLILTAVVIALPFTVRQAPDFLIQLYTKTMGQYFYATVNTCNAYFLLGKNWADAGMTLRGSPLVPLLVVSLAALPLLLSFIAEFLRNKRLPSDRNAVLRLGALGLPTAIVAVVVLAMYLSGALTSSSLGTLMIFYCVFLMGALYILDGSFASLPLYGAGLLILLCNTGAMMHERYVFPAVALLLLAYLQKRDVRILWLAVGVSIGGFLNVGCVLDRNIRIGGFQGSLDTPLHRIASDMSILEYATAAFNCLLCVCTGLLCVHISRGGETVDFAPQARRASPLPRDPGLPRMTRRDWIILLSVTALYAVLAFTNLGSTKAPQTAFVTDSSPQRVVMDLGDETSFYATYYVSYHRAQSQVLIETSPDGETWTLASEETLGENEYYLWKTPQAGPEDDAPLILRGRFVRFTSDSEAFSSFTAYFSAPNTGDDLPASRVSNNIYDDQAVLDLGDVRTFHMLYFGGIHQTDSDFTVEISRDGETWDQRYTASMKIGECFQWKYLSGYSGGYPYDLTGRYVRITAARGGQTLYETLFRDAETDAVLPVTLIEDSLRNPTAAALIDEQDTLEGEPGWFNSTYFDEIYHARTGFELLHGLPVYETTHPPLGKVFISFFIALFGMTPFGWRFAGALAGVLMLPGMYLLGKLLFRRKWGGAAAMGLLALDLMHFTQTRIATIDSFVVLFIIWMFYFMLRWFYQDFFRMKFWKTLIPLSLSGLCMGLGVASKWTGCYAGVALACLFFLGIWRRARLVKRARKIRWRRAKTPKKNAVRRVLRLTPRSRPMPKRQGAPWHLRAQKRGVSSLLITVASCLVFFVAVPALIYFLSYIPFCASTGGVTVQKIIDSANYMLWYHSQPGLGMDHPYYTPWYQWPIIYRPMFYASSIYEPAGYQSAIMAFGNPAVWWVGLAGLIAVCLLFIRRHLQRDYTLSPYVAREDARPAVLLICFFVQYLPWMLVPRGTYIYHYFPCVPIIILCALLCLDRLAGRNAKAAKCALIVWIILSALLFIGFFPYASGALTPQAWMDAMRWFPRIYY